MALNQILGNHYMKRPILIIAALFLISSIHCEGQESRTIQAKDFYDLASWVNSDVHRSYFRRRYPFVMRRFFAIKSIFAVSRENKCFDKLRRMIVPQSLADSVFNSDTIYIYWTQSDECTPGFQECIFTDDQSFLVDYQVLEKELTRSGHIMSDFQRVHSLFKEGKYEEFNGGKAKQWWTIYRQYRFVRNNSIREVSLQQFIDTTFWETGLFHIPQK